MNKQQIFDAAWRGLKAQGFVRSIRPGATSPGSCLYRGPGGLRCALGHVIPDGLYEESFEGKGAPAVVNELGGRFVKHIEFLDALQTRHDGATSPADMETRLRAFAGDHGLTIPGDDDGFQRFLERVQSPVQLEPGPLAASLRHALDRSR